LTLKKNTELQDESWGKFLSVHTMI